MKKTLLALLCLLLFGMTASAADTLSVKKVKKERTVTIYGRVCDSFTKVGIPETFITIMLPDSSVVDTVHVESWDANTNKKDAYYHFKIPAHPQKYIIKGVHPDYKDTYLDYELKYIARNTYFEASLMRMRRKDKKKDVNVMLNEVVIKATKIKMAYKGDTLVYNADAFNLPQGSMLDDLIKQMPGVQLKENGEITVNGKKVDYLTLNGKDFFKGNNKTMLDNLPYYSVKNIQVYDKDTEKSKYLGRTNEKKDYVMDVQLKREYSKGYMANVEGALGSSDRYMSRLFGLRFTDNSRVSIFGNVNNVNETRSPNNNGDWEPSNSPQGLQSVKNVGANIYIDDKDKRYRESADAQVSWNDYDNETRSASETYHSSGNTFSNSRSMSNQSTFNFEANNNFELLEPFYLSSNTSVSINKSNNTNNSNSASFSENPSAFGGTSEILDSVFRKIIPPSLKSMAVNRNQTQGMGDSHDLSLRERVYFMQKLPWGDNIQAEASASYGDSKSHQYSLSSLDYLQGSQLPDYRNQYNDNRSRNYDYGASLSYNIHLPSDWNFSFSYRYGQNWNSNKNPLYRLDRLEGWSDESYHPFGSLPQTRDSLLMSLDVNNSSTNSNLSKTHTESVQVYYTKESDGGGYTYISFVFPVVYKSDHDHYTQTVTDTSFYQRNWLFQPEVNMYMSSKKYNAYFVYRESVTTPTAQNLVNVRDDSNPLAVRYGNPDLKNSQNHSLYGSFTINKPERERSFSVNINTSLVRNQIVDGYSYNSIKGKYTYIPENVNGNWNASIGLNYQSAIDSMKLFSWSVSTDNSYMHNVYLAADSGEIKASRCTAKSYSTVERATIKYQKDDLKLSLDGKFSWQHSGSGTSGVSSTNVYTYNYGFSGQYKFPLQIQFATTLSMYCRRGMSDKSLNTNNLVWNASISRSFIKGKMICRLEGFDILHQLTQIQYNVSSNGNSSTWNNCIPSYFMLHLSYKINLTPGKTK